MLRLPSGTAQQRGMRDKSGSSSPGSTQVTEGVQGGAPGTEAEIPLQPMEMLPGGDTALESPCWSKYLPEGQQPLGRACAGVRQGGKRKEQQRGAAVD